LREPAQMRRNQANLPDSSTAGSNVNLEEIEAMLGLKFSERHRQALSDLNDPIHDATDFLVPSSPHEGLRLLEVNEFLHAADTWDNWPQFLVAFASNGCGDYFAYDLRSEPAPIVYMDPDYTVEENLNSTGGLVFDSFESWYQSKIDKFRRDEPQRR